MSTRFHLLVLGTFLLLFCSCVAERCADVRDERAADAYVNLLQQATRYVFQLKDQNRLPGVAKDEHGNLQVNAEGITDAQGHFLKTEITFPITFTAYLTPNEDGTEFRYRVTKDDKRAGWRLTGAAKKAKDHDWVELQ